MVVDYMHGQNELTFLGVHNAFGFPSVGHAAILIFAGENSEFWNDDRFTNTAWGGGARYVTFGGESRVGERLLRGHLNRDSDVNLSNKNETQLLTASSTQLNSLFTSNNYFNNNTNNKYSLLRLNSNSYARGILDAVGISYNAPNSNLPAWNTRLPASQFGH